MEAGADFLDRLAGIDVVDCAVAMRAQNGKSRRVIGIANILENINCPFGDGEVGCPITMHGLARALFQNVLAERDVVPKFVCRQ